MEGLIGTGTGRTYDDFQRQIPEPVKSLFDKLRTYCMSLDEKVIEDVRMHRIVFCKTMTFRWFADLEPTQSSIIIKIQKERKLEPKILEITPEQELSEIESTLKDAFTTIRYYLTSKFSNSSETFSSDNSNSSTLEFAGPVLHHCVKFSIS